MYFYWCKGPEKVHHHWQQYSYFLLLLHLIQCRISRVQAAETKMRRVYSEEQTGNITTAENSVKASMDTSLNKELVDVDVQLRREKKNPGFKSTRCLLIFHFNHILFS